MIRKKSETQYDELLLKYDNLYSKYCEKEYQLREMKANADSISEQDEEIRRLHESMRAIKHDMKNHLMVVLSYLNDEDPESAKNYISQILNKLNAVHSYIETGNSLMNHILNEKLSLAREKGIDIKAEVENLEFSRMESVDFSALLNNMLDNAIEASVAGASYLKGDPETNIGNVSENRFDKKSENVSENRFDKKRGNTSEIRVTIARRREYETIVIKNRISSSVLEHNPKLETTKEDRTEHGKGVAQIRQITEKYNGMCDFYEEDGFFVACAFIPV